MSKVSVAALHTAPIVETAHAGSGTVETRRLFGKDGQSIHLNAHILAPGSPIELRGEPADHIAYVWKGSASTQGVDLRAGSSVTIEFGATVVLTAGDQGATLIVFNLTERGANARSGQHVHILPSEAVPRGSGFRGRTTMAGAMFSNATCPTCSVWLHETSYLVAGEVVGVHSHSEDEVIFVIDGTIRLGNRDCGPGTALSIAADVKYGFASGEGGLSFINFRGSPPTYTSAETGLVLDEARLWRGLLPAPRYVDPEARDADETSPSAA